jgi:serine/threonine protein phosphatase PrpC
MGCTDSTLRNSEPAPIPVSTLGAPASSSSPPPADPPFELGPAEQRPVSTNVDRQSVDAHTRISMQSVKSNMSNLSQASIKSSNSKRISRTTKHAVDLPQVRDVITHVLGQKKDQDRAVCVPALTEDVLYCGVFDGHGRNGEVRSELATTEIPRLIRDELEHKPGRPYVAQDFCDALEVAYTTFHAQLDKLYEDTVLKYAKEENARIQAEFGAQAGVDADKMRMPQDGGTTATSVLVSGEVIVIGWVGDSRAVLARRIAQKRNLLNRFSSRLKISTLTDDHNVAANLDEEMQRVQEQGGEIYGKHIAGDKVEGMLQLTRSLGDSPFHRTGLVVAKPGLITVPILEDRGDVAPLLFLMVASDGLWDYFSNKEAIEFVYKRLKKQKYHEEHAEDRRHEILTDVARAIENEAVRRSVDRRSHQDDITVLLVTFEEGWNLEEKAAHGGVAF